jgi:hypothetical protein
MIESLKKEKSARIAFGIFVFFSLWWLLLQIAFKPDSLSHHIFGGVYGLMAIWGSICGIFISGKWGGLRSVMGRAIIMFSLGLFAQEFGQVAYFYYNFILHANLYPSIGDAGFFGSIPLYVYGVWLLAKASGIKIGFRSFRNKIQALVIPLCLLAISYFSFLNDYKYDWTHPLTIFLDFGYPIGQAIYISLAIVTYLLSRKSLGGIMKNIILFILFALVVQYTADSTFLYQSHVGNWYVGGINDYMYLVAYFLMTMGLLQLQTVLAKLK